MTQSITAKAIAEVSKGVFRNGLKACGFARKGNHLFRYSSGLIHGVHFQGSRGIATPLGRFTINLVVTSEALYRYWTNRPLPSNPASVLFPVQERIGLLMPDKKDRWWEVDEKTDLGRLAAEVTEVVLSYGLPSFNGFATPLAFLDRLRSGKGAPGATPSQSLLVHAMLAKDAGFGEEAKGKLQEAFNEAKHSGFRETVFLIAKRLDIEGVGEKGRIGS